MLLQHGTHNISAAIDHTNAGENVLHVGASHHRRASAVKPARIHAISSAVVVAVVVAVVAAAAFDS
jgi:hypothetical protein